MARSTIESMDLYRPGRGIDSAGDKCVVHLGTKSNEGRGSLVCSVRAHEPYPRCQKQTSLVADTVVYMDRLLTCFLQVIHLCRRHRWSDDIIPHHRPHPGRPSPAGAWRYITRIIYFVRVMGDHTH